MTPPQRKTCAAAILFITCASSHGQPGPGNPPPLNPLGDASAPTENPITEQKRVLGKILFWDEQLSSDNTVACGTCHRPATGGADPRLKTHPGFDEIHGTADDIIGSAGIRALDQNGQQINDPLFGHDPQVTSRAAPSFFTSMFTDSNFWDGRATDEFTDPLDDQVTVIAQGGALESQAVGPILSSVEMAQTGRSWEDVVNKLEQVTPLSLATQIPADMQDVLAGGASYSELFAAAFSNSAITPSRIAMAIATYERTLVPNETPWDAFIAGDNNFHNIGLRPASEDLGQFEVTGQNPDRGRFKTPSLRNVGSKTALMHLGWITDVSDSFDFYNAGTSDARQADVSFAPTDSIAISARISPDTNDLAQAAQFHVVIAFGGNLFALNEAGGFDLWNGELATLPSADSSAALGNQVNIPVVSGLSQLAGTFDIFVGYTLGDGVLRFNASAFHFVVE